MLRKIIIVIITIVSFLSFSNLGFAATMTGQTPTVYHLYTPADLIQVPTSTGMLPVRSGELLGVWVRNNGPAFMGQLSYAVYRIDANGKRSGIYLQGWLPTSYHGNNVVNRRISVPTGYRYELEIKCNPNNMCAGEAKLSTWK